jgi:hypothetical protein
VNPKTINKNPELAAYTIRGRCTPLHIAPAPCPAGWKSVAVEPSCIYGDTSGNPDDLWRVHGQQRVCQKVVESRGIEMDCCSGKLGVGGSEECRAYGYTPYSGTCNNIMQAKCNTIAEFVDPYSAEGMRSGVIGQSQKTMRTVPAGDQSHCNAYLANAPGNSFYHNHSYEEYDRHFPKQNYTMPAFSGGWGYTPERTPYVQYDDWQWKQANKFCRENEQACWNTR